MPTSSEASADTVTSMPETVALFAGSVMATVGGVVSAGAVLGAKARNVGWFKPVAKVLRTPSGVNL